MGVPQVKLESSPAVNEGAPIPVPPSEGAITYPCPTSAVTEGEFPHAEPVDVPPVKVGSVILDHPNPPPATTPTINEARDDARRHLCCSGRCCCKN